MDRKADEKVRRAAGRWVAEMQLTRADALRPLTS